MSGSAAPLSRAEAAALLAVDPAAGAAEVQRAFLRAARYVHPDVLPDAGEPERRAAADAFDRLLQARDVLLTTSPAVAGGVLRDDPRIRRVEGRGLGGSLVVLALLSFLLVLLLTVEQGIRGEPLDPGPTSSAGAGTQRRGA